MDRRWSRAQVSQKYSRVPFSTEQVQVTGRPPAVVPQREHTVVGVRGCAGSGVRSFTTRR